MRTLALLAALATFAAADAHAQGGGLRAAVADPARPAADRERDALRKPEEVLAFARVRPGQVVVDLIPGGGYFTRIFARAVQPGGRVYAVVPEALEKVHPGAERLRAAMASYPDVEVRVESSVLPPGAGGRVDLVWTAQNYHDLHNMSAEGVRALNAAVFAALKPGGLYVIEDHAPTPGSGARDTSTLHRIDPATVREEVRAAGFVPDGESRALANSADPHTAKVFDPAIRGRTDQFVLRFRKPAG